VKVAFTLTLLAILAIIIWKRRKRVGLAVRVGIALYVLLMLTRLVQMREDSDQIITMGLGIGVLLTLWLVGRGLVALLDQRHRRLNQDSGCSGSEAKSANSASAER
jgi:hypothetical protein